MQQRQSNAGGLLLGLVVAGLLALVALVVGNDAMARNANVQLAVTVGDQVITAPRVPQVVDEPPMDCTGPIKWCEIDLEGGE